MLSLTKRLTTIVADVFAEIGLDRKYGEVVASSRPDLGQFQCSGAIAAARSSNSDPREVAGSVVERLQRLDIFRDVLLAGPGFINLTLTDEFLAKHVQEMAVSERLGCERAASPRKVIVDYGGANIAKPLHVGHLRAAIIGESLKRLARFLGHDVLGDVHLGDWGLQMGTVIAELADRRPDLPYFDPAFHGLYPIEAPITVTDLEEIYPSASKHAKEEPAFMEAARQATYELQQGRSGYYALWQHIKVVSVADLRADYARLNIEFDLWLGESDTQARIPALIEQLKAGGWAHESQGALVVDVAEPTDKKEVPPLILVKSDGAVLYGTTDLATIQQRMQDFAPDVILYVVDKRQGDHFLQVFRAAFKTGIAPLSVHLEHVGFGTMNGQDGKPFKTREGGVVKLKDLIRSIVDKAWQRMAEIEIGKGHDEAERSRISEIVGVATLKFADLTNHFSKDYVFDLDRFSSFEGRTGPYVLYAATRARSILARAADQGLAPGPIVAPTSDVEREVLLKIAELPDVAPLAFQSRALNSLCDYAFDLATLFNRFYHEHHILHEEDVARQASWLSIARLTATALGIVLDILGIEVPEQM
jgi:arginyl-tRNA synthetase